MKNTISQELEHQLIAGTPAGTGIISPMAAKYTLDSDRLLGLLLKLDFAESHIVTCDPWKRKCGGVPRGSFVLFRVDNRAVDPEDRTFCDRLIIARITDAVPTPVEGHVQRTLFQVHKLQAQLDPLTNKDLQWGALKASIVGTYFVVAVWRAKESRCVPVKYWEIIADNLSKAGWSWGAFQRLIPTANNLDY